jgi:hypothetical protein
MTSASGVGVCDSLGASCSYLCAFPVVLVMSECLGLFSRTYLQCLFFYFILFGGDGESVTDLIIFQLI